MVANLQETTGLLGKVEGVAVILVLMIGRNIPEVMAGFGGEIIIVMSGVVKLDENVLQIPSQPVGTLQEMVVVFLRRGRMTTISSMRKRRMARWEVTMICWENDVFVNTLSGSNRDSDERGFDSN